ncbi:hypothetical protein ACFOYZ_06915 [Neobacillus cucumis]
MTNVNFCPGVACLGPNILVKNTYYQNRDFTLQREKIQNEI